MQMWGESSPLRPRRLSVVAAFAAVAVGVAACGSGGSADQPNGTVPPGAIGQPEQTNFTVAIAAAIATSAPIYLADQLGYFKDEGLSVTIKPAGSLVVPLVASGQALLGEFGATAPLIMAQDGKDTTIVLNRQLQGSGGVVVGRPGYTSITDCKKVATLGPSGAGYGNVVRYRHVANASFQIVPVADTGTKLAAVLSGQVDCAGGAADEFDQSVREGKLAYLVDTRDAAQRAKWLGAAPYVEGVTFGLSRTVSQNRNTVERFIRAKLRASQWLETHSPQEVAAELKKSPDFAGVPQDQLTRNVANASSYLPPSGDLTEAEWKTSLAAFGTWATGLNLSDPKFDYANRVDMTYYKNAVNALAVAPCAAGQQSTDKSPCKTS
jgi:NitT/TauT family transport system substrate-binding protein